MYHYKIIKGSSGSFMCPPGHPRHSWELHGFETTRHRNPMSIGSIDSALADDFDGSDAVKARVQKIFDEAELIPSEPWIRNVYGYFRNCYAPENLDRDLSKSITHNRAEIAAGAARKALAEYFSEPPSDTVETDGRGVTDPKSYRDGSKKPMRAARRGWEVTATADGSEVFVYALADDGTRYGQLPILERYAEALIANGFASVIEEPQSDDGTTCVHAINPVTLDRIDPNRHLAVLTVREYFPDHEPRLDLIEDPGKGYGSHPCTKCGERVQYEAKFDKLTKVTTRIIPGEGTQWAYTTECPFGGDHTTD